MISVQLWLESCLLLEMRSSGGVHWVFLVLLLVFCSNSVLAQEDGSIEEVEKGECDDCKFFPTVCQEIENCIKNCNISPSMRTSCAEMDKQSEHLSL